MARRPLKAASPAAPRSRQKPLADLSPAYRRRIERAEAAGKSRQEARGHKSKEHVARRERELRAALTTYERGQVKKFAEKQAKRMGAEPGEVAAKLRRWAEVHGYDRFRQYRQKVADLGKQKRQRTRKRLRVGDNVIRIDVGGRSANVEKMGDYYDDFDLPDLGDGEDGWHWFYYH
jgi:hypothetical protein